MVLAGAPTDIVIRWPDVATTLMPCSCAHALTRARSSSDRPNRAPISSADRKWR
jgi:hypothetical protein